jgi:hypothetical protein
METHDQSQSSSATQSAQLPCRHLRCKEMYYQAPDDDEYASGQFWCNRTQDVIGPDGETCDKKQCCANRTCYVT